MQEKLIYGTQLNQHCETYNHIKYSGHRSHIMGWNWMAIRIINKNKKNKTMEGYLGESVLNIPDTNYKDYTAQDWVMLWIEMYGSIDGAHHKDWLIDQIARILKGAKVTIKQAKWSTGLTEDRFTLEYPPKEYFEWVEEMGGEENYDCGIAP